MEKQHAETEISVSKKEIPFRACKEAAQNRIHTEYYQYANVIFFSRAVSNLERSKEEAPLFLPRENQN